MISEIEEANGRLEGQLLDKTAREAALNDQIQAEQTRLIQANNDINQLKVHHYISLSFTIMLFAIHMIMNDNSYKWMILMVDYVQHH